MRTFTTLVLLGLFGLALPATSDAGFRVRISDSSGEVVNFLDNAVGFDADPTVGSIQFSSSAAGVTIDNANIVLVGTLSKPLVGNPSRAEIDVSIDGTFTGNSNGFRVEVTDTDFGLTPGSAAGILTAKMSSASSDPGIGRQFTGYVDDANAEFGQGVGAGPLNADGTVTVGNIPYTNPFSLTADTFISNTGGAGQLFSFDNRVLFETPVPAGIVLALSALPVLGLWVRLRRNKVAA